MDRIIDIAEDGRHLSRERGFLKVSEKGVEIGRVPLDEIAAVIVHAHGVTWSNSLLAELAERGAPVVLCGSNHNPKSVLMPLEGHHLQGARIRAQWNAKKSLHKQLWKQIIISKINVQAAALEAFGHNAAVLKMMARKVTSGDKENVEAQAARYYWPRLMGSEFRRDRTAPDQNALLNYGYTILRSTMARSIIAAGLHPTIGLHHSNRGNAFALADDLMEPFRPLVDCAVIGIAQRNGEQVDSEAKQSLAKLVTLDLCLEKHTTPLSVATQKLATSIAQSFETGKAHCALPAAPSPMSLRNLGT